MFNSECYIKLPSHLDHDVYFIINTLVDNQKVTLTDLVNEPLDMSFEKNDEQK